MEDWASPSDGGVGQPSGCGGGGGPDPPELEPLLEGAPPLEPELPCAGDCAPDWPPPLDAGDWDDDGEPEPPDCDGCPGLPLEPELGLEGEELPDDDGIELGMPLGIELELVVRQPPVAREAVATNSAIAIPVLLCIPVNPWTVAGAEVPSAAVPITWMRPGAGGSIFNSKRSRLRHPPLLRRRRSRPVTPGRHRPGTSAAAR